MQDSKTWSSCSPSYFRACVFLPHTFVYLKDKISLQEQLENGLGCDKDGLLEGIPMSDFFLIQPKFWSKKYLLGK